MEEILFYTYVYARTRFYKSIEEYKSITLENTANKILYLLAQMLLQMQTMDVCAVMYVA